jgi:hypothetical protein
MLPKSMLRSERVRSIVHNFADGQVVSGPFAGLKYVTSSQGSVFLPKLMGTYELELEPSVSRLLEMPFDKIVVAGAAEGYYAVGFAARSAAPSIIAFEPNTNGRRLLSEMAALNGVTERITSRAICDITSLRSALSGSVQTLVFVDIEGGEAILLDPVAVPELGRCHLMVELHDFAVPGVGELLRDRFAASHDMQVILAQTRVSADLPSKLRSLLPASCEGAAVQAMSERRPAGMSWIYAVPKSQAGSA